MSSEQDPKKVDALDEAVRVFATQDGFMVTGWAIVITATHPEEVEDGGTALMYEQAPGQPWHSTIGMLVAANDYYRQVRIDGRGERD